MMAATHTTPIQTVLDALTNTGHPPKRNGRSWQATCPSHPDRTPSLSITESPTGNALIYCHAGCTTPQIVADLKLKFVDLFPAKTNTTQIDRGRRVDKTYDYHNQDGTLIYQVIRYTPKDFRQRQPNPDGTWTHNLKGITPVLYQTPQLARAVQTGQTIWICEGEKDAENAQWWQPTIVATTKSGGACKHPDHWRPEWTRLLEGAAKVVIIADDDQAGHRHAQIIYDALHGHVQQLHIALPAIPHKDLHDHIANFQTPDQLRTITRQQLDTLAPTQPHDDHDTAELLDHYQQPDERNRYIPGGTFIHDQPEGIPARWGTDDRVLWAEGEALIIVGGPGVGKSTLTANILHGLLTNTPVLDLPLKPANRILYLALDRPRQIARNLRRLLHTIPRDTLDQHLTIRAEPITTDLETNQTALLELAQECDADILIIDSLKDLITDPADVKQGGAWNRAMQHCVANQIDVLALHHNRKKTSSDSQPKTLSEVYGSAWITAGAGSVILLAGDAGDALIELRHLKQPSEEIGPIKIEHHHNGQMTIDSGTVDILKALRQRPGGMTAQDLAKLQTGKNDPKPNEVKKAKRHLENLVARNHARKEKAAQRDDLGRQAPDRYYADNSIQIGPETSDAPEIPADIPADTAYTPRTIPETPSGHKHKSPGQTADIPAPPADIPADISTPPLRGVEVRGPDLDYDPEEIF